MVKCQVTLLDESDLEFQIDQHENGKKLFDKVCEFLNLAEVGYFGLIYRASGLQEDIWLRLDKPLKRQFEISSSNLNLKFSFSVQYYPSDPSYLKEELTKYQICLQIRDDLLKRKLPCPVSSLTLLSSYWLQSEFGDQKENELAEVENCLALLQTACLDDKNEAFVENSIKLYKSRSGMPPADADTQFLRLASTLALYGVHRYATVGMKKKGTPDDLVIGIGLHGVMEIVDNKNTNLFRWRNVKNVNYKKSKFYLKLLPSSPKKKSLEKSYHMSSETTSHAIWRNVVDHHVFFRVTGSDTTSQKGSASSVPTSPKNLATKRKGSFRFSFKKKKPKTEEDVRQESSRLSRDHPEVFRQSSLRRTASLNSEKSVHSPQQVTEKPVKPILKGPSSKPLAPKDVPVIVIGEMATSASPILGSSSLLLTETIEEEDESQVSPLSEENLRFPTNSEETPKNSISSDERANILDEIVSTEPPTIAIEPPIEVKSKPSPNKLLVSGKPTEIESTWHLVPPLVSQSTREAMVVILEEEKKSDSPRSDSSDGAREVLVILGDGRRKSRDSLENHDMNKHTEERDSVTSTEERVADDVTTEEKIHGPSPVIIEQSVGDTLEVEEPSVIGDQKVSTLVIVDAIDIQNPEAEENKPESELFNKVDSESTVEQFTDDLESLSLNSDDVVIPNKNPTVTITPVSPDPIRYISTTLYGEPLTLANEVGFPKEIYNLVEENDIAILPKIEISPIEQNQTEICPEDKNDTVDDKNTEVVLPTPKESVIPNSFSNNSEKNELFNLTHDHTSEDSFPCSQREAEIIDSEKENQLLDVEAYVIVDVEEHVIVDKPDLVHTILPYVEADGSTNQQETNENVLTEIPVVIVDGKNDDPNNDSDTEFDLKTIGGVSAVAVLGDDDVTMDDVNINLPFRLSSRDDLFSNSDSTIEENSETSSFSGVTNDTEELCNPNILDILWAKISGLDDSTNAYERIFNVKKRKNPGRRGKVNPIHSEYYPKSNVSVATQMPSPAHSVSESAEETSKKFIPSWPFNPDSVAGKAKLDEIDREAISAAMRAHIVLQSSDTEELPDNVSEAFTEIDEEKSETNVNDEINHQMPSLADQAIDVNKPHDEVFLPAPPSYEQVIDKKESLDAEIDLKKEEGRPAYERVPSIPLFAKSVVLHHLGSSVSETSSLSRRSSSESCRSSQKSPNSIKTETLIYPPTIIKFKLPSSPRSEVLEYEKSVEAPDSPKNTESLKSESVDSDSSSPKSMSSSGSSKSSFPRFVHSIFPLRKFSWGSSASSKKRKNKLKIAKKKQANKKARMAKKSSISSGTNASNIEVDSKEIGRNATNDIPEKAIESDQSKTRGGQQGDGYADPKSSINLNKTSNEVGYVFDSSTDDSESNASQITDVESLDEIVLSDADEVHYSNKSSSNSQESD